MTDLAYTIAQTDLSNATKQQLKNFVKAIRESWGKVIDLRKASEVALRQYLEDYLTEQAIAYSRAESIATEPVTPAPEVATSNIEENTTVNEAPAVESENFEIVFCDGCYKRCELVTDTNVMIEASSDVTTWITLLYAGTPELPAGHVADINLITRLFPAFSGDWEGLREQISFKVQPDSSEGKEGEFYGVERLDRKDLYADILPNLAWLRHVETDEVFIFRQLSEFEGISDIEMGDWWVSSPLTCDICNYQYCYMSEQESVLSNLDELFKADRTLPKPVLQLVGFPDNPTGKDLAMLASLQEFHSIEVLGKTVQH